MLREHQTTKPTAPYLVQHQSSIIEVEDAILVAIVSQNSPAVGVGAEGFEDRYPPATAEADEQSVLAGDEAGIVRTNGLPFTAAGRAACAARTSPVSTMGAGDLRPN